MLQVSPVKSAVDYRDKIQFTDSSCHPVETEKAVLDGVLFDTEKPPLPSLVLYTVTDKPPWPLSILLGLQVKTRSKLPSVE